jgi:hypothetical protein
VKFIEFAFRLGVIFAIFGFIWGVFQILLTILRGLRQKTIIEEYSLKFIQYFFLVDVTFLFCIKDQTEGELLLTELLLAALILLLFFIGKFQNQQNRTNLLKFAGNNANKYQSLFNLPAEITIIAINIAAFVFFIFNPTYANNPISKWFYINILDIEKTFFFGTIFKIIGFFVLLGILFKLLNGFAFLLSGKPLFSIQSRFQSKNKKEDEDLFDDFEELN